VTEVERVDEKWVLPSGQSQDFDPRLSKKGQRPAIAIRPQRALRSPENPDVTLDTLASPADDVATPDCGRVFGRRGLTEA
jgi:hypothetical protein